MIELRLRQTDKNELYTRAAQEFSELENSSGFPDELSSYIAAQLVYGDWANSLTTPVASEEFVFPSTRKRAPEPSASRQRRMKESMILTYLEEIVLFFQREKLDDLLRQIREELEQSRRQNETYPSRNDSVKTRSFEERKEYLLESIKNSSDFDHWLAERFIDGIDAIPDKFFHSGREAVIPLSQMKTNFLLPLMQAIDLNKEPDYEERHQINHGYCLQQSFAGMSTGESHYVDFFGALYSIIRKYAYRENAHFLILLDEPDSRFHPEWSRQFISNLNRLLNPSDDDTSETAKVFRKYRYQVVVTSHSPMLMSDVPREHIHCLRREKNEAIEVTDSPYGFMSSINDMLIDSFFTESVFGAFALEYTNKWIREIDDMERSLAKLSNSELNLEKVESMERECAHAREQLSIIQDGVIFQSLDRRLNRIERKVALQRKRLEDERRRE